MIAPVFVFKRLKKVTLTLGLHIVHNPLGKLIWMSLAMNEVKYSVKLTPIIVTIVIFQQAEVAREMEGPSIK